MKVEEFLKSKGIDFAFHEHPAVYTCEEAEKFAGDVPGLPSKNLFLKGKGGNDYILVILPAGQRADLKEIAQLAGEKKMTFASEEELMKILGLEAGSVSPFGLINDENGEVKVFIDREVYYADTVNFHPNRNTASLELSGNMFRKFLRIIPNETKVID